MDTTPPPRQSDTNSAALDALVRAHTPALLHSVRCRGVPARDAPDVVQSTFERAIKSWGRYDPAQPALKWLRALARQAAGDYHRAAKEKVFAEDLSTAAEPVEQGRAEAYTLLYELLAALDHDHREVVVMADVEQIPTEEIAAELGVAIGTVYSRLSRARGECAVLLQDRGVAKPRRRAGALLAIAAWRDWHHLVEDTREPPPVSERTLERILDRVRDGLDQPALPPAPGPSSDAPVSPGSPPAAPCPPRWSPGPLANAIAGCLALMALLPRWPLPESAARLHAQPESAPARAADSPSIAPAMPDGATARNQAAPVRTAPIFEAPPGIAARPGAAVPALFNEGSSPKPAALAGGSELAAIERARGLREQGRALLAAGRRREARSRLQAALAALESHAATFRTSSFAGVREHLRAEILADLAAR